MCNVIINGCVEEENILVDIFFILFFILYFYFVLFGVNLVDKLIVFCFGVVVNVVVVRLIFVNVIFEECIIV